MASNTNLELRKQCIYSVYVRNHSNSGNFNGVIKDLDRIKDLGVDIIWLLPIHPIGKVNKKGTLGCPYSIQDYRDINPEYGNLNDFKNLINETHKKNMKIIIDVVYNHTSHDSVLKNTHPEWFYKNVNGQPACKIGDWTDVIDLDYSNKDLWDYQIETLKYWISIGVDGFRCDVASLVPVDFWVKAREEVSKVKKDVIWLAETVDVSFIKYLRDHNFNAYSDCEMYRAFDIDYEYDCHGYFLKYLNGEITLENLLERKRMQEYIYPNNYIKLRFLENHDNKRAASIIPDEISLKNWTAFIFFQKGTALIYAGQEVRKTNTPSLFEKDTITWDEDKEFTEYIKKLVAFKKNDILAYGNYAIVNSNKLGVIEARYSYKDKKLIGIFNVEKKIGDYKINLKDGIYKNIIDGINIMVNNGTFKLPLAPIILEI